MEYVYFTRGKSCIGYELQNAQAHFYPNERILTKQNEEGGTQMNEEVIATFLLGVHLRNG